MASESSPSILSWQFLVLVAASLGIVMNQPGTLPLPPAKDLAAESKTLSESRRLVESQLWQDPYDTAIATPSGDNKTSGRSEETRPTTGAPGVDQSRLDAIKAGKICVMPVIVRGDKDSAEAREMRIRFRIATVSGLGADGFVPDDPKHLLSIQLNLREKPIEMARAEWYLRGGLARLRNSPYQAILVVWLRDSALFSHPLDQLQRIRAQLAEQLTSLGLAEAQRPPDFKVVGPYWSGTLVDMLNEDLAIGRGITFYSSSATMPDGALDLLSRKESSKEPVGRRRLSDPDAGPLLVNLTCTDEYLAESLLNELELRGKDPRNKNSRIAIISDWDTDYGRVLPLTFAAKFRQWAGVSPQSPPQVLPPLSAADYNILKFDDASSWPVQILRAYYISGVEGSLKSKDSGARKPSDESKTAPGSDSTAISLQRAEGEHQVDNIARLGRILAERIRERNATPSENGKLIAIGVLGTDVYDKLLIIQALRPIFKDAIFFTDSLDARFMDPVKAIPYTRNLVVATSFGLDLFRSFQVGAPPFRSTEQTGAFLAVQTAAAMEKPQIAHIIPQLSPLRFEIGRTYTVPLFVPGSPRPIDDKADLSRPLSKFDGLLHPSLETFFPSWPRIKALFLWRTIWGFIALVLLYVTFRFIHDGRLPRVGWRESRPRAIFFSTVTSFAVVGTICYFYDDIEPGTWIQGVSIWPSENLRLLACATAIVSLLVCHSKVRKARIDIGATFDISPTKTIRQNDGWKAALTRDRQSTSEYVCTFEEARQKFPHTIENYKTDSEGVHGNESSAGNAGKTLPIKYVVAEAIWADLMGRSTHFSRTLRSAVMTLMFFIAILCLTYALGVPSIPSRGKFSFGCDLTVSIAATLLMLYLMFWVTDETHLCLRVIRKLGRLEPTLWPMKTYRAFISLSPAKLDLINTAASSYIDVCFIGKLTARVVPLIILPFIVLTLMIVARWNLFAPWRWDALILSVFGLDIAICVFCAVRLRNFAVAAKERSLVQIAETIAEAKACEKKELAEALESLKTLMENNLEGAYVPWSRQKFVSALLIPFGGYGGLGLIEYFLSKS